MAQQKGPTGVVVSRMKDFFYAPPGVLGYSNLVEPDTAFDECKFKANVHYSPEAIDAFGRWLDKNVIDPLWPTFEKEAREAGKWPAKGLAKPSGADWVEEHLKDPKENWKVQTPYLAFNNDAEFKDRKTGQLVRKTMKAWGADGSLKDLKAMKVGMGSIVKAVLQAGIWISPMQKVPSLSFKLQGVQVLKLESYGAAGNQSANEVSDEDLALMGDVAVDDLAGFGAPSRAEAPDGAEDGMVRREHTQRGRTVADDYDDDEIPF